eukprot:6182734-Pleurochrysis_carterae.AAC.1
MDGCVTKRRSERVRERAFLRECLQLRACVRRPRPFQLAHALELSQSCIGRAPDGLLLAHARLHQADHHQVDAARDHRDLHARARAHTHTHARTECNRG